MSHPPQSAVEWALLSILAPLAGYARRTGIGQRRFAALAGRAVGSSRQRQNVFDLPYPVAVRIVDRWRTDARFSSRRRPQPLPRTGARSFTTLVRAARAGNAARAIEALRTAGVVAIGRDGRIRLVQPAYLPAAQSAASAEVLGRLGADFLRLMIHNLTSAPDGRLVQRVAAYDNIPASLLPALRRRLRVEAETALGRANSLLASRDRDRHPRLPRGRRARAGFGVYYFEDPVLNGKKKPNR